MGGGAKISGGKIRDYGPWGRKLDGRRMNGAKVNTCFCSPGRLTSSGRGWGQPISFSMGRRVGSPRYKQALSHGNLVIGIGNCYIY